MECIFFIIFKQQFWCLQLSFLQQLCLAAYPAFFSYWDYVGVFPSVSLCIFTAVLSFVSRFTVIAAQRSDSFLSGIGHRIRDRRADENAFGAS